MNSIFGRNGQRVLALIIGIADLSEEEVDQVTNVWKRVSPPDRAGAWAQLIRIATEQERYQILVAAARARREALSAGHKLRRMDWPFWAAASDAAAAVAAGARIGGACDILTAPLTAVMPSLAPSPGRTRDVAAGLTGDEPPAPDVLGEGGQP
jgi:hypothetical protein